MSIQNSTESIYRYPLFGITPPPPIEVTSPIEGSDPNRVKIHNICFKIHESYNSIYLESFCKELVNQLNSIFSKTTNRRFKYETFELVNDYPTSGTSSFELKPYGFKIVVYIVPIVNSYEEGTCLIQGDDIIVICNTVSISEKPTRSQIHTICHEIAHGFGVALGEYYSIKLLIDFTGVEPEYKVSNIFLKDNYWHTPEHQDWLEDPMLSSDTTNPKFCWLSSYRISSGKHRTGEPLLPDLFNVRIKIIENDKPLDSSFVVVIWRNSRSFYDKIGEYIPDENGLVTFPWNAGQNNHWTESLSDNFRIIKAFKSGVSVVARGISIWDVEESYIKSNFSSSYEVILR